MNAQATIAVGSREELSLDGAWRFRLASHGDWRTANVPNPWQAEFADLRHASGRATYARQISIPAAWRGREVAIRFGAVNYYAEVRLDGQVLGTHEGGYLPFEFVLPADAPAESALEVHVTLPSGDVGEYPDYPFGEIPHGKQSWYGPLGGIWQSVKLIARDRRHIAHVAIDADADSGAVTFRARTSAPGLTLRASVEGVSGEATGDAVTLKLPAPKLWSPESPNLYTATIELVADGKVVDAVTQQLRLPQDRDPRRQILPERRAALPARCARPGLLSRGHLHPALARVHRGPGEKGQAPRPQPAALPHQGAGPALLRSRRPARPPGLDRDSERASTSAPGRRSACATPWPASSSATATIPRSSPGPSSTRTGARGWSRTPTTGSWLKETYDWLKAEDPTRLVVDNSACIPNFHVKTDINDYHYYRSVPERRAEWERLTEEFAAAADWTWTPHGDGERRGDEPLVVSEFGVWGLPHPHEFANKDGSEPWWAETGGNWGDGAAYPHGIQNRFATYHFDKLFPGGLDDFITQVQWYQFANLKYEIESMRAHAPIQGYVITEMTDVHWEANGLLDINRNPRVFHDRFAEVNNDLVIVPQLLRHAVYSGGTIPLSLKLATGGKSVPAGATLTWSLDGATGTIPVPAAEPLSVADLGVTDIAVRGSARVAKIELRLDAAGQRLARNEILVSVYEPRRAATATIAAADPELAAYAEGLGYTVTDAAAADLVLTHALDASDIEAMRQGRRYLVLADGSVETHRNLRTDPPRRRAADDAGLLQGARPPSRRRGAAPQHGAGAARRHALARRLDRQLQLAQAHRRLQRHPGRPAARRLLRPRRAAPRADRLPLLGIPGADRRRRGDRLDPEAGRHHRPPQGRPGRPRRHHLPAAQRRARHRSGGRSAVRRPRRHCSRAAGRVSSINQKNGLK